MKSADPRFYRPTARPIKAQPCLRLTIEQHYLAVKLFARPRWILDAALLWSKA